MIRVVTLLPILALALGANIRNFEGRIIGGQDASIQKFPYQASLQDYGRHKCGASIISPKFILTAAHCTTRVTVEFLSVYVGSPFHSIFGESYKVHKFYPHPKFNSSNLDYDISIVELQDELQLNDRIKPITLASTEPVAGAIATASGWGLTEEGQYSAILKSVDVPVVSHQQCVDAYKATEYIVTDVMFCAGDLELGGKDACQQDSGGPLVVGDQQVGVISWGEGCGKAGYPGVYASVAKVADFITSVTGIEI